MATKSTFGPHSNYNIFVVIFIKHHQQVNIFKWFNTYIYDQV